MKVKAKTNVKYDANWHKAGEVFDIRDNDYEGLQGLAERAEPLRQPRKAEDGTEKPEAAQPRPKPTRRRKE